MSFLKQLHTKVGGLETLPRCVCVSMRLQQGGGARSRRWAMERAARAPERAAVRDLAQSPTAALRHATPPVYIRSAPGDTLKQLLQKIRKPHASNPPPHACITPVPSFKPHTPDTPSPDLGLLASGAVIFGVQRLVPTYDNTFYKEVLVKPE
jgi:hypothetical protein